MSGALARVTATLSFHARDKRNLFALLADERFSRFVSDVTSTSHEETTVRFIFGGPEIAHSMANTLREFVARLDDANDARNHNVRLYPGS